jgi:hypothetical protein
MHRWGAFGLGALLFCAALRVSLVTPPVGMATSVIQSLEGEQYLRHSRGAPTRT